MNIDEKSFFNDTLKCYKDTDPGGAILILKDDDIIFEKCFGFSHLENGTKNSLDSQFRLASVTKQFTAMCIFLLFNGGKLNLNKKIGEIFDDLPESIQEITIIQLLNHTSGILDYENLIPDSFNNQVKDEDVLNFIKQKNETYFKPGSQFRYSNTGYCLLSLIIERISGISFSEYVKQNIFNPLNIKDSKVYDDHIDIKNRSYGYYYKENDKYEFADQNKTSATRGDGGIYISIKEYSKWINSIINNQFPKTMMNYIDIIKDRKVNVDNNNNIDYSFGWFYCKDNKESSCLFHSGESTGFHNIVFTNIDKRISIIIFNNRDDMNISNVFDRILKIMNIELKNDNNISLFKWMNKVYST